MITKDSDDEVLVAACRTGDRKAFRILTERYQRRVYAIAFGYLKNRDDCFDAVQEVFIKVHRRLDSFRGGSSFYTWLYRIVANQCIDQIRKSKRQKGSEYDDGIGHDGDDTHWDKRLLSAGDPVEMLRSKEIRAAVQNGLSYLTPTHRAMIVMREIQNMSYEEMAQAMKCSKGTIMSRLFHARKNLQKQLVVSLESDVPGGVPGEGRSSDAKQETESAGEDESANLREPKVVTP